MENPFIEKTVPGGTRSPLASRPWIPPLRRLGLSVSLVGEVADLEACLALERAATPRSGVDSDGLESPAAIPYCDILMVRDAEGSLAGACRLLAHGPGVPVSHPLSSGRFQLGPLLTALRYSRLSLLEAGPLVIAPGRDPGRVDALLWEGILRVLARGPASLLMGRARLERPGQGDIVPRLLAAYGLAPDLVLEARESFRPESWDGDQGPGPGDWDALLPETLRAALLRGCRLAGEPVLAADRATLELVWVATRDMLQTGLFQCCSTAGNPGSRPGN